MKIYNKYWFKIAIPLFYFGLIYFLLRIYHIDYFKLKDINPHFIRENIKAYGLWVPFVFVLFYILRPLILFPATILSVLGGVIFGFFWGAVLVFLGALLSAVTEFHLSRYYGRKLVMRLFENKNLLRIDNAVEKHGFTVVLLIRLIPNVAFDIQNISLGLSRIKFSDYFLATLFGIIPSTCIYVYLGCSIFDFKYLWKAACVIIALLILYFFVNKFLKQKSNEKVSFLR